MPNKKYQVIYADPPWDYGGKMQYDKTVIKSENEDFGKKIFLSSAEFKYPTVKLKDLKKLDVASIADDDCILFMWTTGPQMANSIELGEAWGFEYFPQPRGARNIRQMVTVHRGAHSVKPEEVIDGITKMFPEQEKIELFARKNYVGWDNWGLEIPASQIEIATGMTQRKSENEQIRFDL